MQNSIQSPNTRARLTKHTVVETKKSEYFILSSLGGRNDCQLISISPLCGALRLEETFSSEEDAEETLIKRNYKIKTKIEVKALIGYVRIGSTGYLLVASKARSDMHLYGGHVCYTIEEKMWIKIPLEYQFSQSKLEVKNIELLLDFPLEGLHYYCETVDLTRPFPSSNKVTDYDPEFCWNEWLASSFNKASIREWCVVLIQGMAISKFLPPKNLSCPEARLCLITRKSNRNPGTRYYARGLNEEGGVGNEMECEIILLTIKESVVQYNSFVWRRGTVPIWWRSELKSQVVRESEVIIRDKPYEQADSYYNNLMQRFGQLPIVIFNMLRCGPQQEETILAEHYQESLRHVRTCLNLDIKMLNFDWHHNLKQLGSDKSIEGLWSLLKSPLEQFDLTQGKISLKDIPDITDYNNNTREYSIHYCPSGKYSQFETSKYQSGIIRFNCADSLDRTNIATFFTSFQLVAEMARRLGVGLDINTSSSSTKFNLSSSTNSNSSGSNNAWCYLDLTLDGLTQLLEKRIIESLAEFFVYNGDVCSLLYTNSAAMHSALMRDYSPNISNAPINALIAIQRRYQNLYLDAARQAQYEIFLGLYLDKYFENSLSLSTSTVTCLTHYPCWSLKHIPSILPNVPTEILLYDMDNYCWISPEEYGIVELYILLSEPCTVNELSITLSSGSNEESTPFQIDLFIGPYLDKMNVIFQKLTLPRATNKTKLYYNITSNIWRGTGNEGTSGLYDFGIGSNAENTSSTSTISGTRIVHIIFHKPLRSNYSLTLGKIELYGISASSNPIKVKQHLKKMLVNRLISNNILEEELEDKEVEENKQEIEEEETEKIKEINKSFSGSYSKLTGVSKEESEDIYGERVKSTINKAGGVKNITFLDTLELEYVRVEQGILPNQRDSILLKLEVEIETLNPDKFINSRDEKTEASLRKSSKYKSSKCAECGDSLGILRQKQCTYCYKRFCNTCMSTLPAKIIEFMWEKPQPVCKNCYSILTLQDTLMKKIKKLGDKLHSIIDTSHLSSHYEILQTVQQYKENSYYLKRRGEANISLADYPSSCILLSVPTCIESPPIESILYPSNLLPMYSYWYAPNSESAVQIRIGLPHDSIILKILIEIDSLGYSKEDMPHINILTGHTITDLKLTTTWPLPSLYNTLNPLETIEHILETPLQCRIITFQLSLPNINNNNNNIIPNNNSPFLHLGRIKLLGCLVPRNDLQHYNPLSNANLNDKEFYDKMYQSIIPKQRQHARPMWAQYRSGRKILDMCIESVSISGFSVLVRHGEEGTNTQVKAIRVFGITTDAKGEMVGFNQIARVIVPKCKANTELYYDFNEPTLVNIVTFEFINNYGAVEQIPPKVALYYY